MLDANFNRGLELYQALKSGNTVILKNSEFTNDDKAEALIHAIIDPDGEQRPSCPDGEQRPSWMKLLLSDEINWTWVNRTIDIIKILLAENKDIATHVITKGIFEGLIALTHRSTYLRTNRIAKYLINESIYLNTKDKFGRTALSFVQGLYIEGCYSCLEISDLLTKRSQTGFILYKALYNGNATIFENGSVGELTKDDKAEALIFAIEAQYSDTIDKTMVVIRVLLSNDKDLATHVISQGSSKGKMAILCEEAYLRNNAEIAKYLINEATNVNAHDMLGVTALAVAVALAEKKPNLNEVVNLLKLRGAYPPIHQEVLMTKLLKWLKIDSEIYSEAYDNKFISELIPTLISGHCNGFSSINRVAQKQNTLIEMKRAIAAWDETAESLAQSPELNLIFNEILQILIFAQATDSLKVATSKMELDDQSFFPKHQFTTSISTVIAPKTGGIFKDYLHMYQELSFKMRSVRDIKEIFQSQLELEYGGRMSIAGYNHIVDVGKFIIDGKASYWLDDSNSAIGLMHFDSLANLFESLKLCFHTDSAFPEISINTFLPPLKNIDINLPRPLLNHMLAASIGDGCHALTQKLIECGAELDIIKPDLNDRLMNSILKSDNVSKIENIISYGADPFYIIPSGKFLGSSTLTLAAACGNTDILAFLLNSKLEFSEDELKKTHSLLNTYILGKEPASNEVKELNLIIKKLDELLDDHVRRSKSAAILTPQYSICTRSKKRKLAEIDNSHEFESELVVKNRKF